ncbi:MAG: pyridoxamine 5'-phosphate oxidase family protein [Pseudomonadota bacterium]
MSTLYGAKQRAFQDRFDTRRLADKVEALAVHSEIGDMDKAFIESRDMFWLSTIDDQGRPTVSYKGGDPGFVRVLDGWKRIDMLQDVLPGKDQGRAQKAAGLVTIEDWFGKVAQGDPEA